MSPTQSSLKTTLSKASSTTAIQSSIASPFAASGLSLSSGEPSPLSQDPTTTVLDSTSSALSSTTTVPPLSSTTSSHGNSQLPPSTGSSSTTKTFEVSSTDQPISALSPAAITTITTNEIVTLTSFVPLPSATSNEKAIVAPSFAHNPGAIAAMLVLAGIIMVAVCFFLFWAIRRPHHRKRSSMAESIPTYPFENRTNLRNVANDRNTIPWGTKVLSSVSGDERNSGLSSQFSRIPGNLAGIGANPAALYQSPLVLDPFADYMAVDINATADQVQSPTTPNSAASTPSFYLSSLAHIRDRDPFCPQVPQREPVQVPIDTFRPLQLSIKKKDSRRSGSPPLSPKLLARCEPNKEDDHAIDSSQFIATGLCYRPESLISEISIPAPSKSMESFHESLGTSTSSKPLYTRRTLLD